MQLTSLLTSAALAGLSIAAPAQKRDFSGPYTVIAHKPGFPFDGLEVQAAGEHFFLSPGGAPAYYCPTEVGSACPNTTDTVMVGSSMDTEVPGGQQMYTQIGGAIAFTQAHSASEYNYLEPGPSPNSNGHWLGFSGEGMTACPVASQPGTWQVYAEVAGFNQTGCACFKGKAKHWTGGVGAWQYV
ncbi:hypothetical protein ANO11243_062750 [Dothideomycetidae sp. 11243]|nr:hypothetical protein ANO11243_062750 [fungal sp. No.11243]